MSGLNLVFNTTPFNQQSGTDLGLILGNSDAYTGENSISDLAISYNLSSDAYTSEEIISVLSISPSFDIGILLNYSGEESITDLSTFKIFYNIDAYSGENNLLDIDTHPSIAISTDGYSGNYSDSSIAITYIMAGIAYTGSYSDSDLTTHIPQIIVPVFYSDQLSETTLSTLSSLDQISYSDSELLAILTTFPAIQLTIVPYTGTVLDSNIQLGITFSSIALTGENILFDLTYIVNQGMPLDIFDGESSDLTLSTSYALTSIGYSGENVLLYFGTSDALYPEAYHGQWTSSSLTLNPFDQLSGIGYSGEVSLFSSLRTTTILPNKGYSGELGLFDLHQNLQPSLLPVVYSDENVYISLQTAISLPVGLSYTGAYGIISSIYTEPNIVFYSDERLDTLFSTTDVFKIKNVESGETFSTSLQVGKSFWFGEFRFYSDETTITDFRTVYHADLYVTFRTSILTQVDIGSATYFDLNTDICCGVRPETTSNNLHINLFVKDYLPEAISDGDRVVFSVNLSCRPRFSVNFYNGASLNLIDNVDYFEILFQHESNSVFVEFESDLMHRLCKGYFIPNGNWVVVEMQDVLPEDCYADFFYSGTTFTCLLSDDLVLRTNNIYSGETFTSSLITSPPWLFIFYTGENMYLGTSFEQALYSLGRCGENFYIKFFEPPYLAYCGETVETEVSIEYHVRFKEVGCFDNEFVFQNDSGDLIPELSNPVPVEGEPYTHSVLGECY